MNQSEIINIIIQTINTIFSNMFSSIDNSVYANLDNLIFVDSNIITNSFFEKLLGSSGKSGLIYLADSMILGISLFYIVRYFYLNIVDATVERPGQFQDIGKDIIGHDINFSELINTLNKKIVSDSSELNIFSLDGLIKSFVSIGLINLLLSYSLRYILLQVLILFSPFAILSLINNSTSWIFKSWCRGLFSLLVIQLFIPLILIVVFCIDNDNKILYVGGIYALTKINDFIREMFGGVGFAVSNNISNMMSFMKK